MKTAIFLQARLDSSRLPKKILLPLAGKPLLQHAMEALKLVPADIYAVLTDSNSEQQITQLCQQCGFHVFAGDPDDVLHRYVSAAEFFGVDRIVRATGDNPLVSPQIANETLRLAEARSCDYAGLINPPYGTAVEVVKTSALQKAMSSDKQYDHEHVTAYVYSHPEIFSVVLEEAREEWRCDARVTIDTPDDYQYIQDLFAALYCNEAIPLEDLIAWCCQNPRSGKRLKVS